MKDTEFLGSSLKVIKGFPGAAKARIGNEIQRLQRGADPTDFKSMKDLGSGVSEICVSEDQSWYRAFYVSKFEDAIYILHAFEKKRNKTDPKDIKAGKKIYNELALRKKKEAKND
jgi:phage-related protein